MLKFAEKYNWWTPDKQKKIISLDTKIEYLIERGTLDELKQALKEVGGAKMFRIWEERFKKPRRVLTGRNEVIKYFVKFHKQDSPKKT